MHIQVIYAILIFICCFLSANAQDISTKEKMSAHIDILTEDNVMLPKDMIAELDQLIIVSKQNNWLENEIKAQTLKAEWLAFLEKLPTASTIVDKYLPIAQQQKFTRLTVRLQLVRLSIYDSKGFNESVELHISQLLDSAKQWGTNLEAGSIYSAVGHSYLMHGLLDKSLIYLKKAYEIFVTHNDQANLSYALNSMANLYADLEDYETSIKYLHESLEINKAMKDKLSSSIIAHNLGTTYTKISNFEQAKSYLDESLKLALAIEDDIGVVWAKHALAELYVKRKLPREALALFQQVVVTFEETGENRELFNSRIGMFDCYVLINELDNAQAQIPLLESLLKKLKNDSYRLELDKRISQINYLKGDFKSAYQALLSYSDESERQYAKEKRQNIQKLKVSFDTEIAEQKSKALQKENELQQLKFEQQSNERTLWLVISCMSMVIIVSIVFLLVRQNQSKLHYKSMALRDTLTQAPNRRAILHNAEILFSQAKSEGSSFSIALVDLDKFKKVNDIYGHDVGDEVLKSFASACKETLRKEDNYGRYGGEEWLFAFNNLAPNDITTIFERIHKTFNLTNIKGYPAEKHITFSAGVAFSSSNKSLQTLIGEADSHLYKAKETGRNRLVFADECHLLS
ncbi:GGDEF domain-containing protein [Thalassotalea sp. M1531]|uniref:diguanylate cyclase n=1 Tax=Thalassotalea algicola TaxID=2716224 RepID=A0A7Y0Q9H6_9GAMM|nr:tetratricopeptide repeat-containing diguanylate cyclase [Thalassotalea algicola]NMP33230.1 GGDEF domain-containing protein [Thalassotalea algicola]